MTTFDWAVIAGFAVMLAMILLLAHKLDQHTRLLEGREYDAFLENDERDNARSILGSKFHSEAGFTLIELMVVVLIIGILIAIGLPTFLNARDRAADRAAQATLASALTAANVYYTDDTTYVGFEAAAPNDEPGINWVTPSAAATEGTVTINQATASVVEMSTLSDTGQSYCVLFDQASGVEHGTQDGHAAACAGNAW